MKAQRRKFTKEFKAQVVELLRAGKPVPEIAREFEFGSSLAYRWEWGAKATGPAELGSEGPAAVGEEAAADELRRLRRLNAKLQLENDILKKAAVILGTSPQSDAAR
jgi:transposase